MAYVKKSIGALNDILGPIVLADQLPNGEEINGAAALTIESGAGFTAVIEASPGTDHDDEDIWIQLAMVSPTNGVDGTTATLTGGGSAVYGRAELVGMRKVRGRVTNAGTAGIAILSVKGI